MFFTGLVSISYRIKLQNITWRWRLDRKSFSLAGRRNNIINRVFDLIIETMLFPVRRKLIIKTPIVVLYIKKE